MDYDNLLIQKLMNQGYGRWQAQPRESQWTSAQFMAQLSPAEAFAVRIGNFNYQVCNGGFGQYWGNNFATVETVAAMKRYFTGILTAITDGKISGDRAVVKKVEALYTKFAKLVNQGRIVCGGGRDDFDSEEDERDACDGMSELDGPFYEVNEAFVLIADAYLGYAFAAELNASQAVAVCRMLVADVTAAYASRSEQDGKTLAEALREEWPDLVPTYEAALAVVAVVEAK